MGRTHDTVISNFDLDRLEAELDFERALADRLAEIFEFYYLEDGSLHIAGIKSTRAAMEALAAWKEARGE